VGHRVLLDDGKLVVLVVEKGEGFVVTEVMNDAAISTRKGCKPMIPKRQFYASFFCCFVFQISTYLSFFPSLHKSCFIHSFFLPFFLLFCFVLLLLLLLQQGFNLPDTLVESSPLTPKDRSDLEFIVKHLGNSVDWVALSFVQT
jgi:hypothetical protein